MNCDGIVRPHRERQLRFHPGHVFDHRRTGRVAPARRRQGCGHCRARHPQVLGAFCCGDARLCRPCAPPGCLCGRCAASRLGGCGISCSSCSFRCCCTCSAPWSFRRTVTTGTFAPTTTCTRGRIHGLLASAIVVNALSEYALLGRVEIPAIAGLRVGMVVALCSCAIWKTYEPLHRVVVPLLLLAGAAMPAVLNVEIMIGNDHSGIRALVTTPNDLTGRRGEPRRYSATSAVRRPERRRPV